MARIRTIKPEFFTSPDTAKASIEARLFYIALWCWADDWGIGEANMNALLGFAFPEDDEKTRKEIQSLCKEVANTYGTLFYENNGRYFYAIPTWEDHQRTQRRAQRRNPTPDDPESQPDKRIHEKHAPSVFTQGTSESTQGNDQEGTGEREQGKGNRGTDTLSSHVASDDDGRSESEPEEEFSEDVIELCNHLASWIVRNGNRKPTVGKTWMQAIDRLIRIDEYTPDNIRQVIDWCQQDEFWQGNILSAGKLRKQFDQLKHRMFQENNRTAQPQHLTASQRRLQEGYEREQRILNGELSFDNTDNPYLQPRPPRQAIEGGHSWTNEPQ